MPELARAYVAILPDLSTFKASLDKELSSSLTSVVIPARFDLNTSGVASATAVVTQAAAKMEANISSAASKSADAIESGISGPLRDAKGRFISTGDSAKNLGDTLGGVVANGAEKAAQSTSKFTNYLLQGLGIATGAQIISTVKNIVVATVTGLATMVGSASDLNEQMSKTNVVFGVSARIVTDFARTTATSFGISRVAALEAAGNFGLLFDQIGATPEQSAKMSTSLVALAGDLASFYNIATNDALEKLRSGLVGEAEPLRSVGVFLTEGAVKAKAYAVGIATAGTELTEGQKILARYELILEQTGKAQGDFARTSDGVANQQRILSATLKDLGTNLGAILLPIVNGALLVFNDLAKGLVALTDRFGLFGGKQDAVAASISKTGAAAAGAAGDQDKLAAATKASAAAADAAKEAQDKSAEAILKAVSSSGAYEKAQISTTSAVTAYLKATTGAADATELAAQKSAFAAKHTADLATANEKLSDATQKVKDAQTAYTAALADLDQKEAAITNAVNARSDAQLKLSDAQAAGLVGNKDYAAAVANLEAKERGLLEAQQSLKDVQRAYGLAQADAKTASNDFALAQEHLALVIRGYGADSREAADATRELASAEIGAQSAELDLADAKDRLAEATRKAAAANGQDVLANRELERARLGVQTAEIRLTEARKKATEAQVHENEIVNGATEGSKALADARLLVEAADGRRADAVEKVNAFEGQTGKLADANFKISQQRSAIDEARVKIAEAEVAHNANIQKLKDALLAADTKIEAAEVAANKARLVAEGLSRKITEAKEDEGLAAQRVDDVEKQTFETRKSSVGTLAEQKAAAVAIEDSVRKQALAYVEQKEKIAAISGEQLTSTQKLALYNEALDIMGKSPGPPALKDAIGKVKTEVEGLTIQAEKPINAASQQAFAATLISTSGAAKDTTSSIGNIINKIPGLGTAIDALGPVFDGFKFLLSGVFQAIGGGVDIVKGLLEGDWAQVWKGAKNVVIGIVKELALEFGLIPILLASAVIGYGPKILAIITPLFDPAIEFFKTIPTRILDAIGDIGGPEAKAKFAALFTQIGATFTAFADLVTGAAKVIAAVAGPVFNFVTDHWKPILLGLVALVAPPIAAVVVLFNVFKDEIIGALTVVGSIVATVFGTLVTVITGALQVVEGIIDVFLGVLTGDWSRVWDGLKDIVGGVFDAVKSVLTGGLEVIVKIVTGFGPILLSAGTKMMGGFIDGVVAAAGFASKGVGTLGRFFLDLPANILKILVDLAKVLVKDGEQLIGGLLSGITTGWKTVLSFITGLPGVITKALPDLAKTLVGDGVALVNGLLSGITTTWLKITAFFAGVTLGFKTLGTSIANAFSTAFKGAVNVAIGAINALIKVWNGIQFKIPEVHVKGTNFNVGGFTVGFKDIKELTPLARGGTALGGGMHLVGEQGPELFVPNDDGYVMTHADTKRLLSSLDSVKTPGDIPWGGGPGSADMDRLIDAVRAMQPNNYTIPDPAWAETIAARVQAEQAAVFGRIRL